MFAMNKMYHRIMFEVILIITGASTGISVYKYFLLQYSIWLFKCLKHKHYVDNVIYITLESHQ